MERRSLSDFTRPSPPLLNLILHHHLQILSGLHRPPFIAQMMYVDSGEANVLDGGISLRLDNLPVLPVRKSCLFGW